MKSNIGFIRLDPRGVLAANNIFQVISHTIKTKASGQFVINQVIFHTHLTFFKADKINSMLNQTKNINTIIADAHINDSFIFHPKNIAELKKNNIVIPHIIKSNFCKESKSNFFIFNY
jgi:hypothetical protein